VSAPTKQHADGGGAEIRPRLGEVVDDRFLLTQHSRQGGMATVHKAVDSHTGEICALKRMKHLPDDMLIRESFNREFKALENLRHPNIVEMVACGLDADHFPYIALEWLDLNLEEWIGQYGPMRWVSFWPQVGRPLLDAIKTAQSSRWLHRDIKPKNILMTAAGAPKLSDYGIASDQSRILNPHTLRDFRSKPYSPPEDDDGTEFAYRRDLFSWAVVAGYCLTGREPADYGEIADWLGACVDAPVELLRQAASLSRETRPAYAAVLLQEIDSWVAGQGPSGPVQRCYVRVLPSALTKVAEILGCEAATAEAALKADFEEVQGARPDPEEEGCLRLYGARWLLVGRRSAIGSGILDIVSARMVGPAEAERQRDAGYAGPIEVVFARPVDDPKAPLRLDNLFAEAQASEQERQHRAEVDRVFRAWHAYLSARYEYEAGKASALGYSDRHVNGRMVSLTMADAIPPDIIGQDRMIRFGQGKFVALEVTRVNGEELTLSAVFGDPEKLPRRGLLEVNTVRAEKALDRQRQALNAVMHRRAANPKLRDIILDPSTAQPPGGLIEPEDPGAAFDVDKKAILKKALNLRDILTVEGPPGTGKTRLIEEIVVQYLKKHPTHRVLISSQTHVALDNVIERVRERRPSLDIVRVGRADDPRISRSTIDLLLEKRAKDWSRSVASSSRQWLLEWADEHGVDRDSIAAGVLALTLARLLAESEHLTGGRAALERQQDRIEASQREVDELVPEGEQAGEDSRTASETVAIQAEELARVQSANREEQDEVRARLAALGGIPAELSQSVDKEQLQEFAALLVGDTPDHRKCRALMELQEEWLARVGRSTDFQGAMLASASVVAATCVGLAGVRGMEGVTFDLCIVDEASKATATEVIVPLAKSRRAIIVGDPRQLPPFFDEDVLKGRELGEFSQAELQENIFDRLLERLPAECRGELTHQHRMVEPIGRMISEVFYEGRLINEKLSPKVSLPNFPKLITWLDTSGQADRWEQLHGTSYVNPLEARVIKIVLSTLAFVASKRRKANYSVAVIAGYQAQVSAIEAAIMDARGSWSGLSLSINTVDAFQGSEADICIYSVVRSNRQGKVGFLRERPRLNVALSRGRDLLIVVGDHEFCSALGPELPMASVVRYGADNEHAFEVRPVDVT